MIVNWNWDSIFLFTLLHTSEGFCIAKPLSLLTARTKLLLHHHRRRIFLFFLSASFFLVLVIFMEWGVNNLVSSAIQTTFCILVPGLIISHDQNDMLSLWRPNALLTLKQAGDSSVTSYWWKEREAKKLFWSGAYCLSYKVIWNNMGQNIIDVVYWGFEGGLIWFCWVWWGFFVGN